MSCFAGALCGFGALYGVMARRSHPHAGEDTVVLSFALSADAIPAPAWRVRQVPAKEVLTSAE